MPHSTIPEPEDHCFDMTWLLQDPALRISGNIAKISLNHYRTLSSFLYETEDGTIDLPIHLESEETLREMGFRDEVAAQIWKEYQELVKDDIVPVDFFHCAVVWITGKADDSQNVSLAGVSNGTLVPNLARKLDHMGITPKLRDELLDPAFANVRNEATAVLWVEEAMQEKFQDLKDKMAKSQDRAAAMRRQAEIEQELDNSSE